MTEAKEILSRPEYFTCERFGCNMKRTDCVAQQIRAADKGNTGKQGANHPAYRCKNCEQGKRIIEIEKSKKKGDVLPVKKEIKKDPEDQNIKANEEFKVKLDFTGQKSLLGFVHSEAKEEFRGVEGQIMAIVRDRYKNEGIK